RRHKLRVPLHNLFGLGPGQCCHQPGRFCFASGNHFISPFFLRCWFQTARSGVLVDTGLSRLMRGCRLVCAQTDFTPRFLFVFCGNLIYAVEVRPQFGGRSLIKSPVDVCGCHLRFQRTLPSLLSSTIIPCSASSLRISSLLAKSRRCRAACLWATFASTQLSVTPSSPPPNPSSFNFSASLSFRTAKIWSNVCKKNCAEATSSWPNPPLTVAIFASRTKSKVAANATAVFKS